MIKDQDSRYFFGAQGGALGGFLATPVHGPIETQAAVSLPASGGISSSRVAHIRPHSVFSFKSAHSYAFGHKSADGQRFETLVTSVVEGLNILDVVTAERVVARVAVAHPDKNETAPTFTLLGSHYEDLRIGGQPVQYRWLADYLKPQEGRDEQQAFVPTPLVADVRLGEESFKQNFVQVPGFGRVYLAEMIVSPRRRRLTMLRVELGCPVEGRMEVSYVEGEGHRMP